MNEYQIKHLETGNVLETIAADSWKISEANGLVIFYREEETTATVSNRSGTIKTSYPKMTTVVYAVTQVSPSTLIVKKPTEKPAVVGMPKKAARLTDSTAVSYPEDMGR